MLYTKRYAFFIFLTLFFLQKNIPAQSFLNADAALVFSTFKFISKTNNPDKPSPSYSSISSNAFGIGYKYIKPNGLVIVTGAGIRKAGASLIYNSINYTWNLQYIDLKAGIGYQYSKWPVKPYMAIAPYYAYLLNARQVIGLSYYDIKSNNAIKSNDFGVFTTAGFNVPVSRHVSVYTEYNYVLGLRNIETSASQYLYNRGSSFKLGLLFNISTSPKDVQQLNTLETPTSQTKRTDNTTAIAETSTNQAADTLLKQKIVSTDTLSQNIDVKPEELNDKQLQDISKIAVQNDIIFTIQIIAVKNILPSNHEFLKNLTEPVQKETGADGWIRYYTGSYKTYEKANQELNKIKSNETAADGFIVAFKNGKKITVGDAKTLLNKNYNR